MKADPRFRDKQNFLLFDMKTVFSFILLLVFGVVSGSKSPANIDRFSPSTLPDGTSPLPDGSVNPSSMFKTKVLLMFFALFVLILVTVTLVVGHFTWLAELKEKLREEHRAKLAEKKKKSQTGESSPATSSCSPEDPFGNWEKGQVDEEAAEEVFCSGQLCIQPHHSILCPLNQSVPKLDEALQLESRSSISSLGLASPVPIRANSAMRKNSIIDRPITPSISPPKGNTLAAVNSKKKVFPERDLESGRPTRPSSTSPSVSNISLPRGVLDISKMDMI